MSDEFNEQAYNQVMVFLTGEDTDHGDIDWGDGDDGNDRDHDEPTPGDDGAGDRPRLRIEVTLPYGIELEEVEEIVRDLVQVVPLSATTQVTSDFVFVGAGELSRNDIGYSVQFQRANAHAGTTYYVDGVLDDVVPMGQGGLHGLMVNGKLWTLTRFDVVRLGVAQ